MHRFTRRRPSPAMLVALTALFVALGGTASAIVITSASIRDNSVRSRDIRDGTIQRKDLSKKARAKSGPQGAKGETGAAGAPGAAGAAGAPGAPGAPGPSVSSFAAVDPAAFVPLSKPPALPVGVVSTDVTLPFAGRLTVNATARFISGTGGGSYVGCRLQAAAGPAFSSFQDIGYEVTEEAASNRAFLAAAGGADLPAGTHRIRLACHTNLDYMFDRGNLTVVATGR